MVLRELLPMSIEEVPIESREGTRIFFATSLGIEGATFAVIRHPRDVGATCSIWLCHHLPAIGMNAHTDHIGDHDPVVGIDEDLRHPIEELLRIDTSKECKI